MLLLVFLFVCFFFLGATESLAASLGQPRNNSGAAHELGRTGTAAAASSPSMVPPADAAASAAPAAGARARPFLRLSPREPYRSKLRLRHLSCAAQAALIECVDATVKLIRAGSGCPLLAVGL